MIWSVVLICMTGVAAMGFADEPVEPEVVRVYTSDGVVEGEVVEVGAEGVSLKPAAEGRLGVVVPWFDVRGGEGGWEVPEEFAEIARASAVGKMRRDRGDLRGCGEMYLVIAGDLLGLQSEMAREVFGGLLEEALVRGDFFDALVAMLALERSGVQSGVELDRRYQVHVGVPMLAGSQGHRLGTIGVLMEGESDEWGVLIRGFGVLNGVGVGGGGGREKSAVIDDLEAAIRGGGEYRMGMELYSKMLTAQRHGDAEVRREARAWLSVRSRMKSGGWIDAWCRCAIGASYLYESEIVGGNDELVSRGVVELIHVMVRDGGEEDGLGRWAALAAAGALRERGRFDEAGELLQSFDR